MMFELPDRKHFVHKPIEPRKLSAKNKVDYHNGRDYLWQLKYDGCNMFVVITEGRGYAFSRTGEFVYSMEHVVNELIAMNPGEDYVFFGEAYAYDLEHNKINGLFRRTNPAPQLAFMMFDAVPLVAFMDGEYLVGYEQRLDYLRALYNRCPARCLGLAHTFDPARLDSTHDLIENVRQEHPYELDGFVAKKRDGFWYAGAGAGGEQLKVKDHLSLDLKCVGLVEGQGKFAGMVGAIQCEYKGKIINVGGGKMTTFYRETVWNSPGILVGRIVEVHALAESAHGDLREARFQRVRHDKNEPDA